MKKYKDLITDLITAMKKYIPVAIIAIPIIVLVLLWIGYKTFSKEGNIHIALVGPMTTHDSDDGNKKTKPAGNSFFHGVRLYIDEINQKGGINGKRIVLDVYDDRNDPKKARERATEIKNENRAVAVIGHHYSSCSIAAGEIYKKIRNPRDHSRVNQCECHHG